jgi:hypothetical protein
MKNFLTLIKLYFSYTPWYDCVQTQSHKGSRGVNCSVHYGLNGRRSLTQIGKLCVTSHKLINSIKYGHQRRTT